MQRPLWLSAGYWRHLFSLRKVVESALSAFGALWLAAELMAFFEFSGAGWLRDRPWFFFLIGAGYTLSRSWPSAQARYRLAHRDIWIELRVGDLFECEGALVISATRTFETDTDSGRIALNSLQGQFTERYYDSCTHLQSDVATAMAKLPQVVLTEAADNNGVFPIGTTLRVQARGRAAYLLALPLVNQFGTAKATFEDLKQALPGLWECILHRGELEAIAVPVLGSGRARILDPRESIIREIVQSFIAACAEGRLCDKLTIAIAPADFNKHEIDFIELCAFIKHLCSYTSIGQSTTQPIGTAVS